MLVTSECGRILLVKRRVFASDVVLLPLDDAALFPMAASSAATQAALQIFAGFKGIPRPITQISLRVILLG
jgi:hypothetical protein